MVGEQGQLTVLLECSLSICQMARGKGSVRQAVDISEEGCQKVARRARPTDGCVALWLGSSSESVICGLPSLQCAYMHLGQRAARNPTDSPLGNGEGQVPRYQDPNRWRQI